MAPDRQRLAFLAVSFTMNLLLGSAYSWTVFTSPAPAAGLANTFGSETFTAFASMLPFAVALATFSLGMTFSGRFVDRHGPRAIAMLGGALVAAGYLLSALVAFAPARTIWPVVTLVLTYGVVMGLGLGFSYNPPIPTAARWFPDKRGLAMGVIVMGYGLSPIVTAPLAQALVDAYGVPWTFLVMGVLFLAVLVPLGSRLRFPPEGWRAPEPKAGPRRRPSPASLAELDRRAMVRSPAFWSAWVLYALGTASGFMVIGKAKQIAGAVGLVPTALAFTAVMFVAVFNSVGRPLFGRTADAVGPRRTLLAMYLLMLGAMALLAVSSGWFLVYAGMALTGLAFGGFLAVMPTLSAHFFGHRNLGSNYGLLFTGYGLGAIVATFAVGPIYDAFGSYVPAFYSGVALCLVGLVVAVLVRPPRPASARPAAAAGGS